MTRLLSSAWLPSSGAMNMVLAVSGSGSVPSRWFSGLGSSRLLVSFKSWLSRWTSPSLSQAVFMPSSCSAAPGLESFATVSASAGQMSLDSAWRVRPPLPSVTSVPLPPASVRETSSGQLLDRCYGMFTLLWSPFTSNVSNLCAVGWTWGQSADLGAQQDYFQPLRGWCSPVGSDTASATGTYSASSLRRRHSSSHCSFLFSYSGVPLQTRPPRRSSSPVLHMREHERCRSPRAAFLKTFYLFILLERVSECVQPFGLVRVDFSQRRRHHFQVLLIISHLSHRHAVEKVWQRANVQPSDKSQPYIVTSCRWQ